MSDVTGQRHWMESSSGRTVTQTQLTSPHTDRDTRRDDCPRPFHPCCKHCTRESWVRFGERFSSRCSFMQRTHLRVSVPPPPQPPSDWWSDAAVTQRRRPLSAVDHLPTALIWNCFFCVFLLDFFHSPCSEWLLHMVPLCAVRNAHTRSASTGTAAVTLTLHCFTPQEAEENCSPLK